MAADTAITHMTFFIASILVAASISGVIIGISNSMANGIDDKETAVVEKIQTNIQIINDPRFVPYDGNNLTIYIKNSGDITLAYNDIAILIDGHIMDRSISIISENGAKNWAPSLILDVEVNLTLANGDHTVKAVMANGISDTMAFRV